MTGAGCRGVCVCVELAPMEGGWSEFNALPPSQFLAILRTLQGIYSLPAGLAAAAKWRGARPLSYFWGSMVQWLTAIWSRPPSV